MPTTFFPPAYNNSSVSFTQPVPSGRCPLVQVLPEFRSVRRAQSANSTRGMASNVPFPHTGPTAGTVPVGDQGPSQGVLISNLDISHQGQGGKSQI